MTPSKIVAAMLFQVVLIAQTATFAESMDNLIQKKAQHCADALVQQKHEVFSACTYPLVVEKTGGRDRMIKILKEGSRDMQRKGVSFESAVIDLPIETKEINQALYAIVPQHIVMNSPAAKLYMDSHLIGVSKDKGKTWYFLDASKLQDQQMLEQVLPGLSGKLKIPPARPPRVVKK
jgi:hypothetical protein